MRDYVKLYAFVRIVSLFILAVLLLPLVPFAAANPLYGDMPEVDIQSRSAILVHAQTGEILFSSNIHIRREPASLTKVLTALLALELGSLDDVVTAEEGDFFDIIPDGSNANPAIVPGEEMRLGDLIYCAMIVSANEAANIIARHIAGSIPEFIELMNERMAEIGAENTRFTNTHGLPDDNHYSTAYDLHLLAKEAIRNPRLMEIAHLPTVTISGTNIVPDGRVLNTTNDLISRHRRVEYIYPRARGIKTGRTTSAGFCLMSSAEHEGITLISVVLGAWIDEETNLIRSFTETRDLFEWGFENFSVRNILRRGERLAAVPVIQGFEQDEIFLVPERSVEVLLPNHLSAEDITRRVILFEPYNTEGVLAPVEQGDIIGEVELTHIGRHFDTVPLVSDRTVERDTIEQIQTGFMAIIRNRWVQIGFFVLVAAVAAYIIFVIVINRRRFRRNRNMASRNYRGRRRR